MSFVPRDWQVECLKKVKEYLDDKARLFVLEACMGAGKSTMAAWIAKTLRDEYAIDHVLVLVPWTSIKGDVDKGMIGSFGEMGLLVRERFFSYGRTLVSQPRPEQDATVTLYADVCRLQAIETIKMWQASQRGFRFALICDEIHHTNEFNSTWGSYVEKLHKLASFSLFMSGTFFRMDKAPISCIPLENGIPIKHHRYSYSQGVDDGVVRPVTTRNIDAKITLYDTEKDKEFQVELKRISKRDLSEAKKQVFDPAGACIRELIRTVHEDFLKLRSSKFKDAACLFVCQPGGSGDYTLDQNDEDRHVELIAEQIKWITGITPTIVTYRDQDADGKIAWFRKATDPYMVAINKVSEGCDIPRFRATAFCRYTESEMLYRQIVGRALRMHIPEDGTAAQIYQPAFPLLLEFGQRLYSEAQEGIRNRRCPECGKYPCICPCPRCEQRPCICPCSRCGQRPCVCEHDDPRIIATDAQPLLDGGHVGSDHVLEYFVDYAAQAAKANVAHRHLNPVQTGLLLQQFANTQGMPQASRPEATPNPNLEHEALCSEIETNVKRLGIHVYERDFRGAFNNEIKLPFGAHWKIIKNTWSLEKLRRVAVRIRQRTIEVFGS